MNDVHTITKAEHEEWLRMPATVVVLHELRDLHRMASETVLANAEMGTDLHNIRYSAGFASGIRQAIYHMAKEPK